MKITHYKQLNFIGDVWNPRYSTKDVLIACYKVRRSKLDIKLRFSKVEDGQAWSGDYYIKRSDITKLRKRFNNSGMACYAVPLDKLQKIEYIEDKSWA